MNWQPVDGLVLHVGANELNSRVKNGPYMGKRVANAPNLTLDANVRYELPRMANGLRPYLQVSDSYQSTEFFENNNFPLQTEPGYSLVNLRAGIMSRVDGQGSRRTWDVAAWVHNLTDKIYRTGIFRLRQFYLITELLRSAAYLWYQPQLSLLTASPFLTRSVAASWDTDPAARSYLTLIA